MTMLSSVLSRRKNARADQNKLFSPALADFINSLAVQVERELVHLGEPTFVNPVTGQRASSLDGCLRAVGFKPRLCSAWPMVVEDLLEFAGRHAFIRHFDKPDKDGKTNTVCLDLDWFQPFFLRQFPELGQRYLDDFPELCARRVEIKRRGLLAVRLKEARKKPAGGVKKKGAAPSSKRERRS